MKSDLLFFIFIIIYFLLLFISIALISSHSITVKSRNHLKKLVFIHNNIFLHCTDNNEKTEALEKLEIITRTLGVALENYKIRQINTFEMSRQFKLYEKSFDNLTTEYPWIFKYELHDGNTFEYWQY